MNNLEPKGAAHWIDHFVVGTNDMVAWADWAVNGIGLTRRPFRGLTTAARKKNIKIICFLWWQGGSCRIGAFLQPEIYPPANELGKELPRCGFYIRPEDIDTHLRRLDKYKIPRTDPVKTSADGDEGTAIYFADPDGNQYEFWAPVHMPEGAMQIATEEKVGRISHAVYGCRDLSKTAAFFEKYCGIEPERSSKTAEGTLVLRLRAGARLVYKLVDRADERRRTRTLVGHAYRADGARTGILSQLPAHVERTSRRRKREGQVESVPGAARRAASPHGFAPQSGRP
ncbi:MAG: VOC family protein [Candidatus Binatia bacterium]